MMYASFWGYKTTPGVLFWWWGWSGGGGGGGGGGSAADASLDESRQLPAGSREGQRLPL